MRSATFLVLAAAFAAHLPALSAGAYVDDYAHLLALRGETPMRPWSLFDFGTWADWRPLTEAHGGAPWWTSTDWKVRFFRPLASVALWATSALSGGDVRAALVVSLGLWAALLGAVLGLLRALGLDARERLVAVALLGASSSTVLPVGWAANQNALLEVLLTVFAVRAAWGGARGRAWLLALLAAGAKESGALAFLWIALAERLGAARGRSGPGYALVCTLSAALWLGGLALLGYGTRSAFYLTPWSQPVPFLLAAARLVPLAALHATTPLSLDMFVVRPELLLPAVAAGTVALAGLAAWSRRWLTGAPAERLLLAWTVLSLVPQAVAPPSDRLLLGPVVAFAPLLARVLLRARAAPRPLERRAALAVLTLAVPLSFAALVLQRLALTAMAHEIRATVTTAEVGPPRAGVRDVYVLQTDNSLAGFALSSTWAVETGERDVRFWILQLGRRGLVWRRLDARTFELASLDEPLLTRPFELVYRAAGPPATGEEFRTGPLTVTVTDADGSGVRSIRVRLERPLEDEGQRFLVPRDGRWTAIAPPAVGEMLELPAVVPAHPFVP